MDGHFVETQSVEQEINLIIVKVDYVMDLYYPWIVCKLSKGGGRP